MSENSKRKSTRIQLENTKENFDDSREYLEHSSPNMTSNDFNNAVENQVHRHETIEQLKGHLREDKK